MTKEKTIQSGHARKGYGTITDDGGFVFRPSCETGEKLYTVIGTPVKNAILQKTANIYKVSVSTPIDTPNPAKVLRAYFNAAIAPLEK